MVHIAPLSAQWPDPSGVRTDVAAFGGPRLGLIVSKKVGNAVVRNRVKRRLRHLVRDLATPVPSNVVVRALPPAASEPERLASDLASAWQRAVRKAQPC